MSTNVNVTEGEATAVNEALRAADALATAVISGKPGQMRAALDVAKALSNVKRQRSSSR